MRNFIGLLFIAGQLGSSSAPENKYALSYTKADFETSVNGKPTTLFTLKNEAGMVVTLTNYGAKIVSILVPDKDGNMEDVCLGFKNIGGYLKGQAAMGAVVGPYANRIANAQFEIDGKVYELPGKEKKLTLHSGPNSFYRQVFDASEIQTAEGPAVRMRLESPDGEWGFPGNKLLFVTYTLTSDNSLRIDYEATTDKACHFNLTNHAYFNLKGEGMGDILGHVLVLDANYITKAINAPSDSLGRLIDIRGTAMDFVSPHTIGERIDDPFPALRAGNGYDHNYILNKDQNGHELTFCASLYEPLSGRYMECFTTEPAVQLYSANFMKGDDIGKRGNAYNNHCGVCLETQHYPDSPNNPEFPNTLLLPGDTLKTTTIYKFSVRK